MAALVLEVFGFLADEAFEILQAGGAGFFAGFGAGFDQFSVEDFDFFIFAFGIGEGHGEGGGNLAFRGSVLRGFRDCMGIGVACSVVRGIGGSDGRSGMWSCRSH
jgi:hypothetical protein